MAVAVRTLTFREAINEALAQEMERDPKVVLMGEDVAGGEAIARARRGDGPALIEAKTWRYFGHFEGDQVTYRTAEQTAAYREHDPLTTFAKQAGERGLLTKEDVDGIHQNAEREVDEAIAIAEASPLPAPDEALTDVYVAYR